MQKIIISLFCSMLFLTPFTCFAQMVTGVVFDQKTQTTLPGATVYQDGTTNVTVTDFDGAFRLNSKGSESSLMITYIGYHTKKVDQPLQYVGKQMKLYLNEQSISLDEVEVGGIQIFSRKQMLKAFREQFLGTSTSALRCKIINEDDLLLKYNPTKKTLTATTRQPLQIINNYLDYEISFDLVELVVTYTTAESLNAHAIANSYFSGSTFYVDKAKNESVHKKRLETFYGSRAHFIQALAYGKLEEEQWEIYVNKLKIKPEEYFEVTDTLHYKKIKLIKKPERLVLLSASEGGVPHANLFATQGKVDSTAMVRKPTYFTPYYHRQKQSLMEFLNPVIYVDPNGNYTPIYGVVFGGALGALKAGDLLPIEYFQTSKEMQNAQKGK